MKRLKRVCAWCEQRLDDSPGHDDLVLTHGVCPECRRRHFSLTKGGQPPVNDPADPQTESPHGDSKR